MAVTTPRGGQTPHGGQVQRASSGGGLVEIIDRVLDKGIVIDAWVRVSLVGIELITIEARIVIASVDTYLKYAEAIGATELVSPPRSIAEPAQVPAVPAQEPGPDRPSEEEVLGYLSEHPAGLPISELEQHFRVPRSRVEDVVNQLLGEQRLRKDEERQVLLPA